MKIEPTVIGGNDFLIEHLFESDENEKLIEGFRVLNGAKGLKNYYIKVPGFGR